MTNYKMIHILSCIQNILMCLQFNRAKDEHVTIIKLKTKGVTNGTWRGHCKSRAEKKSLDLWKYNFPLTQRFPTLFPCSRRWDLSSDNWIKNAFARSDTRWKKGGEKGDAGGKNRNNQWCVTFEYKSFVSLMFLSLQCVNKYSYVFFLLV